MTPTQADELGKRIINTWRGGPPLAEWRTELEPLDEGRAGTAFARLKRTSEHAPTIAKFMAEYGALRTGDPSANLCPTCSDSGWTPQIDHIGDPLHYEANGVMYSGAKPCTCRHGQNAAESQTWKNATRRRFTIATTKGAAA